METEENIPVWALTVQNEPEAKQTWESCLYTPEEERDFVRDQLGPALEHAGLGGVHLLVCDHNRDILYKRASAVYLDPAAARYVWGAALHWYVSEDFGQSSRLHDAFPEKAILFTEGCVEQGPILGAWGPGERYAHNMIGDFRNWVCGYIDWNIALDQRGGPNHVGNFCDAPVIVDTNSGEVHYQKFVLLHRPFQPVREERGVAHRLNWRSSRFGVGRVHQSGSGDRGGGVERDRRSGRFCPLG